MLTASDRSGFAAIEPQDVHVQSQPKRPLKHADYYSTIPTSHTMDTADHVQKELHLTRGTSARGKWLLLGAGLFLCAISTVVAFRWKLHTAENNVNTVGERSALQSIASLQDWLAGDKTLTSHVDLPSDGEEGFSVDHGSNSKQSKSKTKAPLSSSAFFLAGGQFQFEIPAVRVEAGIFRKGSQRSRNTDVASLTWAVISGEMFPLNLGVPSFFGYTVQGNKAYAIGGSWDTDGVGTTNRTVVYDPADRTFTVLADLTTARAGLGAASARGKIYAIGGVDDNFTPLITTEVFLDGRWSTVSGMSTGRTYFGVAALRDKVYAFGGLTKSGEFIYNLASGEVYNPAEDTWTAMAGMAQPRAAHAVAVLNGKIYAIGGFSSGGVTLGSTECYNAKEDTWEAVGDLNIARNFAMAGVLEGVMCVVGGIKFDSDFQLTYIRSTECYDEDTKTWTLLDAIADISNARYAAGLYSLSGL